MSFVNMQKELLGDVPGIALPYAKTTINQALATIYDEQRWSFQVAEAGWLTPGLLGGLNGNPTPASPGTITVAPYSTAIVGDAVATAYWAALVGMPLLTQQQIRLAAYSLYNIIAYDNGSNPLTSPNYPYATLTIDRPWMEPAQLNAAYMIYQAYFPVPVQNFKKFGAIRDTTNNNWVNYWKRDQAWLSVNDAQRTVFDQPVYAVPYEVDARPGSATLGNMMYELWPHPLSVLPYTYSYLYGGPLLALPSDTVPYPLNEELVMWRAKSMAYLWKFSQMSDGMERGSGADWKYLSESAMANYKLRLKSVKLLDAGLGDLYWTKVERGVGGANWSDGYETTIGTLNVGLM
jgi:hypothetical protein